jgi:predicted short-subunit dehydrogenase-like oxidoreductase (DUF2520 family)
MRIVLFGTGNLATRLGIALRAQNAEIVQVFGRSKKSGQLLSGMLGCDFTSVKSEIRLDADLYILAVSEGAIPEILADVPLTDQLVVHTSGSLSIDLLSPFASNYGVFYPLQTFSKQKPVDFLPIPVCIEANSQDNLAKLETLARTISGQVFHVNSGQRRQLHLAAVFVCNFVNHLYAIGEELLLEQHLEFDLLKPLIRETAEKIMLFPPHLVQTGPAVRGVQQILDQHEKMLESHPEWQILYDLLSTDIHHTHNS